MKQILIGLALGVTSLGLVVAAGSAPPTQTNPHRLVYQGTKGPGVGKHIVLIAGDHEYRSEEILPALGRLLASRFGFTTTILFTLDAQGFIEPGSSRMDGLEALRTADVMVVGLRFQDFPASQMQHIVDYLDRAGPVVGIRTSTHAFQIKEGPYAKYTWNHAGQDYLGGFGRQVLGETWVGHYGTNHKQSSRVVPIEAQAAHPVLRGVRDVHVVSGGYKADPIPGSLVLAKGVVLNGMQMDAPPDPAKEQLPVAWTRTYSAANGAKSRVFTSTHGASEDFVNQGFRRMLVNSVLWAAGMETTITANLDVSLAGPYHPVTFSFGGYRRQVRPADMSGWNSPIMDPGKPIKATPAEGQIR